MMLTSGSRPEDMRPLRATRRSPRYLLKPVKQSELLDAIVLALGSRGRRNPAAPAAAAHPAGPGTLRVLLAEDSLVNQKLAVGLLEKQGHAVTVANTAARQCRLLANDSFDLVLMDVQMPEMDGLEATQAIRAAETRRPAAMCRSSP